jgi:hypothetical protein
MKVGVVTAQGEKLFVRSTLGDAAPAQNDDLIRVLDSRDAVGYQDRGAPPNYGTQAPQYSLLGFGVDA